MAEPVSLRRNRDFTLLWVGHTISVLGSQISATAYPLLVLALTGSPATAGVVLFLAWLLPLVRVAAVAITPDAMLGRMQSVARLIGLGGIPLGALAAGLLLETAGASTTALVLPALMGVVALVATGSRGVRDAPALEELT